MIKPCFAELAFNVVFVGKAESAMELNAGIRRFPTGFRSQVFGHVGLRAAGLLRVKQRASLPAHQVSGFNLDVRFGNGELHALVLPDGSAEDDAFAHVFGHPVNEPMAVADAFGSDQGAFGIQAIEDVFETMAFHADQVLGRNFEVFKKQFIGFVIHHVGDGPHRHAGLLGLP